MTQKTIAPTGQVGAASGNGHGAAVVSAAIIPHGGGGVNGQRGDLRRLIHRGEELRDRALVQSARWAALAERHARVLAELGAVARRREGRP
jgi:hypothetical protein